jgi:hypothetical protein
LWQISQQQKLLTIYLRKINLRTLKTKFVSTILVVGLICLLACNENTDNSQKTIVDLQQSIKELQKQNNTFIIQAFEHGYLLGTQDAMINSIDSKPMYNAKQLEKRKIEFINTYSLAR